MNSLEILLLVVALCGLSAAVMGMFARRRSEKKEHYVCPWCGYYWKPFVFSANSGPEKELTCPHCGVRGHIRPIRDDQLKLAGGGRSVI